jgi:hypothetical protein
LVPGEVGEDGLVGEAAGQQDGEPQQAAGQEDQSNAREAEQDRQQAKVQPSVLPEKLGLRNRRQEDSVSDPDWLRIRIGNPDPDLGSPQLSPQKMSMKTIRRAIMDQ